MFPLNVNQVPTVISAAAQVVSANQAILVAVPVCQLDVQLRLDNEA